MTTRTLFGTIAAIGLVSLAVAANAQERSLAPLPRSGYVDVPIAMAGIPPLPPLTMTATNGPRQFSARREGTFNGRRLAYRAELSEVLVKDGDGSDIGSAFTSSYVAQGLPAAETSRRPVLFAFNGGPGASSLPLRFTSLGPRRLASALVADMGKPDNGLVANPASPLDVADIVFIDPPDTGYGRTVPGKATRIRSVDTDSEMFTHIALNWLKSHSRLASPVFVLGESYGSLRAIAMARDLARAPEKKVVAGIVLVGTAFTFGSNGRTPSPVHVASELPMMASVAWHYGKIDNRTQTWQQAVDKARAFVRDRYVGALMLGNQLDPETREQVVKALPGLIGVPESYFRERGTIAVEDFNAQLLRAEGRVLDRNDGLQSQPAPPAGQSAPRKSEAELVEEMLKGYAALIRAAEAEAAELKATGLDSYRLIDPKAGEPGYWSMAIAGDPALDVTLAKLLQANPAMQLLVLQGRYDTLTDLGTTEYMLAQTNVPPSRYRIALYDGGHMLKPESEAMGPLRAALQAAAQAR